MTKTELAEKVAQETGLLRQTAKEAINVFFATIKGALLAGEGAELRGFGSFRFRQRKGRLGRNPRTGSLVKVPAKKVLYFKPSKLLKDLINKQ